MELQISKWGLRLYATLNIRRIRKVTGVNSRIDEYTHFLMWDFDDTPLYVVTQSLRSTQKLFNLPSISIVETKENGYHAYCWKSCSFVEARGIISFTPNIDKHYLAIGIGRGYFTLRFTDVKGRGFKHVLTLHSDVPPDLSYKDVNSFVNYTKAD